MGVLTFHGSMSQTSSGRDELPAGILGGPEASSQDVETLFATISSRRAVAAEVKNADSLFVGSFDTEDTGTLLENAPLSTLAPIPAGSKIINYIVQSGDTLTRIAHRFDISLVIIQNANQKIRSGSLHAGDRLAIPVAMQTQLASSQGLAQNVTTSNVPPQPYFIMPVNGLNWGILHHYNAVDIAAPCGTPVMTAADGLVVPDTMYGDGTSGWNGGYGKFVLLKHPFGSNIKTRYAHLEKVLVTIGDYIKQGEAIGLTGETGDATGCHVHFEVYGAKNPFVKT